MFQHSVGEVLSKENPRGFYLFPLQSTPASGRRVNSIFFSFNTCYLTAIEDEYLIRSFCMNLPSLFLKRHIAFFPHLMSFELVNGAHIIHSGFLEGRFSRRCTK